MFVKKALPVIILWLLVIPISLSDNTVKTVNFFGGFVNPVSADTPYSKSFTFKSPDGFEKLYFAKAIFFVDNPNSLTARFYVKLNDSFCSPNYYDIPASEKRYRMDFDCSGVFSGEGVYEGGFQSNKNLNNVYGEWSVTYKNNPALDFEDIYENVKTELNIFGTEYVMGEKGSVWAQLVENSTAIDDASCYIDVYYPDKTLWIDKSPLIHLDKGIYYFDFITPDVDGVYISSIYCYYDVTTQVEDADVENLVWGTVIGGGRSDMETNNGVYYKIKEEDNGTSNRLEVEFEFNGITISNQTEWKELDIYFNGMFDGSENIAIWIYNFNTSSWDKLPNEIDYSTDDIDVGNAILYNKNHYLNSSQVKIRLRDTDETDTSNPDRDLLQIDQLILMLKITPSLITEVRGGGEIHISESSTAVNVKSIGGTEYAIGDLVTQAVQLLDIQGRPIYSQDHPQGKKTVSCNITIIYENDSIVTDNKAMSELNETGIFYYRDYFYDIGVYTSFVECKNTQGATSHFGYGSNDFHVSEWASGIINISTNGTFINEFMLHFAGGTEYQPTQQGIVAYQFLRTIAGNPSPINDADWCNTTIWYPNDTVFSGGFMTYLNGSDGIYYYVFSIPSVDGLYRTQATCKRKGIRTYGSGTFHVVSSWVTNATANVTLNITYPPVNITYPCEDQILCLLEHAKILHDRIVKYKNDQYCVSNTTLRHNITYEYCRGASCRLLSDISDEECEWGCDYERNECSGSPTKKVLIALGVVGFLVIVIIVYRWWF